MATPKLDPSIPPLPGASEDASIKRLTQTIFEHAALISRESDITRLLQLNADLARDLTGADRCSVWLIDERAGQMWTKVAHGIQEIRLPLGSGIVGAAMNENQSLLINHPQLDPRFLRSVDQISGYRTAALLAVPLRADGKVIGAMEVLNKPGGFSNHDLELLSLMSLYSAAEIQAETLRREAEAARLLRWELDMASEVQNNLLPRAADNVAGLGYAAFFQPAESVGGDFYDFLQLPGDLFSFTVGDVSGKGMPAAVLMASIQTLLRSHLIRQPLPLAQLVAEVSRTLYLCSSLDRYATLFCGVLDAGRRQLTYVNAGHPPPILIRGRTRSIEHPAASGLPIGIQPHASYEQTTLDVSPGDLIVCLSDGVTELANAAGDVWEAQEMESIILAHRDQPVPAIVAALVSRLREYSAGIAQSDDITVSAIQILP